MTQFRIPRFVAGTAARASALAVAVLTATALTAGPAAADPTSKLTVVGGYGQQAVSGSPFTSALSVKVTGDGSVVPAGTPVTFTVVGGSASFKTGGTTATGTTDAAGLAVSPALSAGSTAGLVSVAASSGGGKVVFLERVLARATDIALYSAVPPTVSVGQPFRIQFTVLNRGRLAAGKTVVRLYFPAAVTPVSFPGGALAGQSVVFSVPALPIAGAATFQVTVTATAAGSQHFGLVTRSNLPDPATANNRISFYLKAA